MHCEELRSQFTDYLTDALDPSARSTFEEHLSSCTACRGEVEALTSMWTKLAAVAPEEPDSPAQRERFNAMLEGYSQGMQQSTNSHWWSAMNSWVGAWWPRQPVFQFGLALVLLFGGVAAGQYFRLVSEGQQLDLDQLRAELRDTRQIVVLSLMQQQSASDRMRGVSWSNRIEQPDNEVLSALLDTLMHDPNVNVRLAAVDALKKFGESQIVRSGTLQALMQQDSPVVQVALIDFMVDLQEKDSVETLRMFAQDMTVNEGVRQRAVWGLEQFQ